jgi:hypothetical protein
MPRIRTIVIAAICGVPGPVIVTVLTLVAYGGLGGGWESGIGDLAQVAFRKIQRGVGLVIIEALLGFTYGGIRGFFEPKSVLRGTLIGASVWLVIGFPFFIIVTPGSPENSHAFGLYCEHVAAGAIVGMHVELFLLRTRSKRRQSDTPNEQPQPT